MPLTEALAGVVGYDPQAGRDQPAQRHLSTARGLVREALPPIGYLVKTSGVSQTLPKVPWIAVLDPDVTTTAQRGLYLVYLFDTGTRNVYLSMNQGATAHLDHHRQHRPTGMSIESAAKVEIERETAAIRSRLDPPFLAGTVAEIQLGSNLYLPRAYEAGNIAAIRYDLANLPPESRLREELQRFLALYEAAVAARLAVVASSPTAFHVPAPTPPSDDRDAIFQPQNPEDYFAWIAAHAERRTRKHAALVNSFADFAASRGWQSRSKGVYPRDLVLDRGTKHLLVEAKTVHANSQFAVREAIGQLLAYEFLYYQTSGTTKVALFSAPVGPLWVELLGRLSIATVWLDGADWHAAGESVAWVTTAGAR